MDYQILSETETEKEIEFLVNNEELSPFIEQEVTKLRKKVALKGYRKGRVPKSILKARFQNEIKANALNELIKISYLNFLEGKNLQPVSQAELISLEEGEKIKFRLRFEVVPDFDVNGYIGIELFKEKALPIEYLYEEIMNELRERYATIKETDEPASVDNFVRMDLEIIKDNRIEERQTDITVKIGDRSLPDEINRSLVGVKRGEKKEVRVGDKIYKINIKMVEEKMLPLIDDNFARMLNFKDTTELKKKIEEMAKANEEARLKEELEESLARILLERNQFTVPQSLIEIEYKIILKEYNFSDSEANKEKFWEIAERRARFNLIVEKIAKKENIQTGDEEVMELMKKDYTDVDEKNKDVVMKYLKKELTKRKVVDFLLKNAVINEKKRIILPEEAKNVNRSVRH